MAPFLSLAQLPAGLAGALTDCVALAAGNDGLFAVRLDAQATGGLTLARLAQPMSNLAAVALSGERLLVGGSPHGVASLPLALAALQPADDAACGPEWRGGWMDHTAAPVIALASMPPASAETANEVVLAASWGDGVLRSEDGGRSWRLSNSGLTDTQMMALAWAPPPAAADWPAREIAFAGADSGLYRSPAGGRAWRAAEGISGSVHAVAPAASFRADGLVLAASTQGEEETTIWRSTDGGRSFVPVHAPFRICHALAALPDLLLAACDDGLWSSIDGQVWAPVASGGLAPNAFCLLPIGAGLLAALPDGVTLVSAQLLARP